MAADGARPESVLVAEGAGPRDGGTSPDLDMNYINTWSFIQRVPNPNMSYAPVRVPYLWARNAPRSGPRSGPRGLGPGRN